MLLHISYTPKTGISHEEAKQGLKLWESFQPSEGYDIKQFYCGVDGSGYAIVEAATAETAYEVLSIWAHVYNEFKVMPVVEIDKAVGFLNKAIAIREAT